MLRAVCVDVDERQLVVLKIPDTSLLVHSICIFSVLQPCRFKLAIRYLLSNEKSFSSLHNRSSRSIKRIWKMSLACSCIHGFAAIAICLLYTVRAPHAYRSDRRV